MGETSYDKTTDDFVAMYRDVFRATIRHRPGRRAARIGTAAIMLALLAWVLDRDGSGFAAMFYGAAVGVVIAVPVCWGMAWLLLPRRARALYAQDRTTDPHWKWRWSESELEGRSADSYARYRWTELHHWHDGRHTLLFFLNDAHVLYIPRRMLTASQATELRTLADDAGVPRR